VRFAYADPPYIGCARYYIDHPDYAGEVDHRELIATMVDRFHDGWALSCKSSSLRELLPLCPEGVRVMAWVKPFCSFKPNVNPAYAWEPVIVMGGRKRGRKLSTVRDWVSCGITLKKGLVGVKPPDFCRWLFSVLNIQNGDELVDLFPGSGAVSRAFSGWVGDGTEEAEQGSLFPIGDAGVPA
jgi:hypothetical protein